MGKNNVALVFIKLKIPTQKLEFLIWAVTGIVLTCQAASYLQQMISGKPMHTFSYANLFKELDPAMPDSHS